MALIVQANSGKPLDEVIDDVLRQATQKTMQFSGRIIAAALEATARNHVAARYPGSSHWQPSKISKNLDNSGSNAAEGSIDVNIPGATRAYHDIDIYPIRTKWLTIPIHLSSYGKKAADFSNIFKPKNKNMLAQVQNGKLVALFALCKHVHQKQDDTLLPSDQTFAENIGTRWMKEFEENLDKAIAEV